MAELARPGLTDETARWRPDAEANSISWLLWHLSRVQDDHVAGVAGIDRCGRAIATRPRSPWIPTTPGTGTPPTRWGWSSMSADLLNRYQTDVHTATLAYLEALTEDELGRVVDDRWDPPVTAAVRLVSVIDDCAKHLGQADYVRGLADRRNAAWHQPEAGR